MRVQNTKVKFTIPIPVDKPDCNGVVYTKEAIEKAINRFGTNLPIVYKDDVCDNERVIGVTTDAFNVEAFDSENQVCNMTVEVFYFIAEQKSLLMKLKMAKCRTFELQALD